MRAPINYCIKSSILSPGDGLKIWPDLRFLLLISLFVTIYTAHSTASVAFMLPANYIAGTLSYNNSQSTPLAGVPVHLRALPGYIVMSDTTDSSGNFRISGFPDGNYFLDASLNYEPGGVNTTDALTAAQVFSSFTGLPSLQTRAGDVNGNTALNTSDALLIARFSAQVSSSFPIGRFVQSHPFLSIQSDSINVHLWVLSAGDLNGSYSAIPTDPHLLLDTVYIDGSSVVAHAQFLATGSGVYERGICWSTSSNPSITDQKAISGKGSFDFSWMLNGFSGGTTYFFRAYASHAFGTTYSNEQSLLFVCIPTVETLRAVQIGDSSVHCEGIVHLDGGSTVVERGFVFDTLASSPHYRWNSTAGWGRGSFNDTINGLFPSTPYYFRAYAQNTIGTAYGSIFNLTLCTNPRITSGVDSLCLGTTGAFLAFPMGGIWRSNDPSVAYIDSITGVAIGLSAGSTTITYTVVGVGGCLNAESERLVSITAPISVGQISGNQNLCVGSTDTYTSTVTGGRWSSSNTAVATVNTTTGLVTALSSGTATITYTVAGTGGCADASVAITLTVTASPSAGTLSGNQNLCVGSTDTYTSTVTGGSWSSSNPAVASVNTVTGLVTAIAAGTSNILYTIVGSGGCTHSTASRTVTVCIALPSLTTIASTSINSSGASTGGVVISGGGDYVSARGVVYGTSANPTLSNQFTQDGNGIGSFVSVLTGLTPATAYRVRAYATNSAGTAYGNEILFTTTVGLPVLVTSNMSQITHNSAQSGGTISTDGGATITQRGVCWSSTTLPTISNSRTQNGTGTGAFTSNLTGLTPSTQYYIRAYATNSAGTAYGQQQTFTTTILFVCGTSLATDLDGNNYATITLNLTINSQLRPLCWFKQNLRVSKYRNGDPIPTGLDTSAWRRATTGAMASPNDSAVYDSAYGKLYNWYALADPRGICPIGWHVATDAEYLALTSFCQSSGYPNTSSNRNGTGRALKSCRQINTPYSTACNTTAHPRWLAHNNTNPHYGIDAFGFSALPAGARVGDDGSYQAFGGNLLLQTPNLSPTDLNYGYLLRLDAGNFSRATGLKTWGGSVRCVRDY